MKKLILLILCFPLSAFAQGIAEIQQFAIDRSAALGAEEMEERALRSETMLKQRWGNPQFVGQFGTLKSGSQQGSTTELTMTQPIPLSDKFSLRSEIAKVATKNQEAHQAFFKNWVSHQVVLSVWHVYTNFELLKHGKDRANRLGLVKKYLESRPRITIKQRIEHALIESILRQLEREQDLKQQNFNMALSDYEFWTGKKPELGQLPVNISDSFVPPLQFEMNTAADLELIKARNQTKLSSLDSELAVKEKRPDLFLGGGYRVENVNPVNHFSYAIVGLTIPLWDTGNYRVEASRAREMKDKKNLEEMERKVALKQYKHIELVKFNIEQLKRFPKKLITINDKTIREAEAGFRQGVLDVNTFLQAETQCHEVIDQVFSSWMNYLESLSSLQLMKGESPSLETK